MNKVFLIGRTTKTIELMSTRGGTDVVRFSLAVDRRKKDDGADFVPCSAFGKTAELIARYVEKGHRIGIAGHLQTGSYEKDGRKIYTTDVIIDEVEFLEKKDQSYAPITDTGDLPF